MKTFWTCWVEGTNGGYGRQHPSFVAAAEESDRLAQLPGNVGKPVYVLQCLGATVAKRTQWDVAKTDDLPF